MNSRTRVADTLSKVRPCSNSIVSIGFNDYMELIPFSVTPVDSGVEVAEDRTGAATVFEPIF